MFMAPWLLIGLVIGGGLGFLVGYLVFKKRPAQQGYPHAPQAWGQPPQPVQSPQQWGQPQPPQAPQQWGNPQQQYPPQR
ncbi:hypothetical protein [Saccharopolyspora flava]|uniref:Uncharacterized protein n=1 Tax=Saccharopolyspora flava TaxID=95161 RepID=A0A1I6PU17_9PSEU|nr:hypothetical protein [Saccharopolyspora flava]SFS43580.1 hypothetical protein SAMN05660874_01098 [Saccharopolyspora flava]